MPSINTPPNFDLEPAIVAWRTKLTEAQNCSAADVAEVEAHLRDGIDRLRALGLSVEEAFFVSARRLGDPQALSLEFAKADPLRTWRIQLIWMAAGFVGASLLGVVTRMATVLTVESAMLLTRRGEILAFIPPLINCLIPLTVLLLLVRSVRSSRFSDSGEEPSPWVARMWRSLAAHPALCVGLVVGVFSLEIVGLLGLAAINWKTAAIRNQMGQPVGMAISLVNWALSVALPIVIMILALRARKSLAQAALSR